MLRVVSQEERELEVEKYQDQMYARDAMRGDDGLDHVGLVHQRVRERSRLRREAKPRKIQGYYYSNTGY